jgi:uncharacterized protein YheU (UPF0270 family)
MNDDPSGTAEREADADPVEVPHAALDPETLRAVIESFVLREGTDYGERELALEDKVSRVRRLLECGEARIVFDPRTETVDVVTTPRSGSRPR